jgi:hypothetical protein
VEFFGKKGARGLKLRAGREFTGKAIEGRSMKSKTAKASLKLLPQKKRIKVLLESYKKDLETVTSFGDSDRIEIREEDDSILLIDRDYYGSDGITTDEPMCDAYVGMIHYFIQWFVGDDYQVQEIECRAKGHPADVFKIWKE